MTADGKWYELTDAFDYIVSDDYKERFIGEYMELSIRLERLRTILARHEHGTLDFAPGCSINLLIEQADAMDAYKDVLERRAIAEGINLDV